MKKHYFLSLNEKILFLIIIVLFLFTRLFNLSLLPVFCDEAIYIRWAQIIKSVPELKFISLSDGKQPLFMWLMVPFLKIFPDPLFGGRMVSVFSGLISLIGVFFLSLLIFNSKRSAFFASLIYIVLPYTLFFDRMALVDSLLMALGIWVLIFGILVVKTLKLKWAIIGGFVLGLSLLTKSPALFFVFLLFIVGILVEKANFKIFLRMGFLLMIFVGIGVGIYNLLRLSPSFYMINLRNKDYIFSFKEILLHPHDPLLVHLKDITDWFPNLFTWPILSLSILGFFWGMIKKPKETLVLGSWCLLPLIIQSFIAKVFNSRYLLFTIFPLIIFGGFFLERILGFFKRLGFIKIILVLLIFFPALKYDFFILTSPAKAPLTTEMRRGYLSDWTSGWGIKEVKDYLKDVLKKEKEIVVGTEGFWGTLPDGLQIYFDKEPRIKIIGVGLDFKEIPQPLKEAFLNKTPTFLVGNQSRLGVNDKEGKELELIFKIPKPVSPEGSQDYFLFYRLK
ncbi:MAG: ArnT family glycosyltransferase [Microgenomates group bacterium]